MRSMKLVLLAVVLPVLVLAPPATAADPAVSPTWVAREDGSGGRDLADAVAVSP